MQITEYVSIEKQYLLDAKKYIERASIYINDNKLSYAAGCLAKACKKLNQSEKHNLNMDGLALALMQPMLAQFVKSIEDKILKG